MYFIDKYRPEIAEDASFNKEALQKLKIMSTDNSIPHIIFYGPEGCGKKTVIKIFLDMIFGKDSCKTTNIVYPVVGSGNTCHDIIIKQSKNHIVIEPNNNNFDRYVIQEVVNEYAKRVPLDIFDNSSSYKKFKIVLIDNIDKLSYYAQTSLRRTMEKYSKTCRFIMWSRSLSKVIDPLRSRSNCFKLTSPSEEDMFSMLLKVSAKENIDMTIYDYDTITLKADGDIKKALWLLQLKKLGESYTTSYDKAIVIILKYVLIFDFNSMYKDDKFRQIIYRIMITNISGTTIIKDVIQTLMEHPAIKFKSKVKIAEAAAKFEHNLIKGRREIIHLEAFFNTVMCILHEQNKNLTIKERKILYKCK
jgi:replication factor C subunit 3/5